MTDMGRLISLTGHKSSGAPKLIYSSLKQYKQEKEYPVDYHLESVRVLQLERGRLHSNTRYVHCVLSSGACGMITGWTT